MNDKFKKWNKINMYFLLYPNPGKACEPFAHAISRALKMLPVPVKAPTKAAAGQ